MENHHFFLGNLFSMFSSVIQAAFEEYREEFIEQVEFGNLDLIKTREAVDTACMNTDFDWKKYLKEQKFYLYDDRKTVQELLLDCKLLFWDVLFPERVLEKEIREDLYDRLLEILSDRSWYSFDEILKHLSTTSSTWENLDYYDLHFVRNELAKSQIELRHEIGSKDWFFRLVPRMM
jgi:hypothetical protein